MYVPTCVPICEYAYNSMEMEARGQCGGFIEIKDLKELLFMWLTNIY